MVAEHVAEPHRLIEALARLTKPGGIVIVYTTYKWSPIPLLTRLMPFALHHPVKRFLWGSEERDTFPVSGQINTRRRLRALFAAGDFAERLFEYLNDCSTFSRWPWSYWAELSFQKLVSNLQFRYPEACLLGVYARRSAGRD